MKRIRQMRLKLNIRYREESKKKMARRTDSERKCVIL